jgi:tripartite motif-containing protein 71
MQMRYPAALIVAALVPALAWGQAPPLLSTWTTGGSCGLGRPWHLALDLAGNVYVADLAEHRVFAFSPAGVPLTSWDCPAMPLLDFEPQGIAITRTGHVYVATPDAPSSSRLFSFTTGGDYLGPVGAYGPGPCEMYRPFGVAVDDQDHLYVADVSKSCVEVITSTGDCVTQWGEWGEGTGQFHFPLAIAVSATGLVYVTDDDNQRIQVFTTSGAFVTQWGSYGAGPGQFAGPWGIALDAAGNVYVADSSNNRIQVFTDSGEFITQWGTAGSGPGQFNRPRGIAVAPDGTVYVSDTWNCRIQVFGPVPTPTTPTSWGRIKTLYR